MTPETKICTKCGCLKSIDKFSFRKERNAYRSICKQCMRLYFRKWYKGHSQQLIIAAIKRQKKHPEQKRTSSANYYKKHTDKVKANSAKQRKEHPEYHRNYDRNYRQTPQGKISRKNSNINRRARTKGQRVTLEEWTAIKQQQGFRCYWCKQKFPEDKLTMDHVIALKRGGLHEASNIVASCQPCNSTKHTSIWSLL